MYRNNLLVLFLFLCSTDSVELLFFLCCGRPSSVHPLAVNESVNKGTIKQINTTFCRTCIYLPYVHVIYLHFTEDFNSFVLLSIIDISKGYFPTFPKN